MPHYNKNGPIFIVGCERSGTTMLRLIIHSHRNIALPPQTKYIKKLYKRRFLFGDLSKNKNRQKLQNWFWENHNNKTKLIDLDISKNTVQIELKKAGNSLGAALAVILKIYSTKLKKDRWGDKHPYYIKYLSQLFALFPDAQVIHIIRDGRDAVASLKRMPWWKHNSIYAMLNWQEAIQKGRRAKKIFDSNHFMEIRYENIINDPKRSIKAVCAFLNEEYSPDMLEFHQIADRSIPTYKMDWHSAAKKQMNSSRIGLWETDLKSWEKALMNNYLKMELSEHNYDIPINSARAPIPKHISFIWGKLKYKSSQFSRLIIDRIMSFFYPWDLDYRK